MFRPLRGFLAGVIATCTVAPLVMVANQLQLVPPLDMLSALGGYRLDPVGLPLLTVLNWSTHFLLAAALWSLTHTLLARWFSGEAWAQALIFSLALWLFMLLALLPLTGAGLMGLGFGLSTPMVTLVLHLAWGSLVGLVHRLLPHSY